LKASIYWAISIGASLLICLNTPPVLLSSGIADIHLCFSSISGVLGLDFGDSGMGLGGHPSSVVGCGCSGGYPKAGKKFFSVCQKIMVVDCA